MRAVVSEKHHQRLINFNKRLAEPESWRDEVVLRRTSWSDAIGLVQQSAVAHMAPLRPQPDELDVAIEPVGTIPELGT